MSTVNAIRHRLDLACQPQIDSIIQLTRDDEINEFMEQAEKASVERGNFDMFFESLPTKWSILSEAQASEKALKEMEPFLKSYLIMFAAAQKAEIVFKKIERIFVKAEEEIRSKIKPEIWASIGENERDSLLAAHKKSREELAQVESAKYAWRGVVEHLQDQGSRAAQMLDSIARYYLQMTKEPAYMRNGKRAIGAIPHLEKVLTLLKAKSPDLFKELEKLEKEQAQANANTPSNFENVKSLFFYVVSLFKSLLPQSTAADPHSMPADRFYDPVTEGDHKTSEYAQSSIDFIGDTRPADAEPPSPQTAPQMVRLQIPQFQPDNPSNDPSASAASLMLVNPPPSAPNKPPLVETPNPEKIPQPKPPIISTPADNANTETQSTQLPSSLAPTQPRRRLVKTNTIAPTPTTASGSTVTKTQPRVRKPKKPEAITN